MSDTPTCSAGCPSRSSTPRERRPRPGDRRPIDGRERRRSRRLEARHHRLRSGRPDRRDLRGARQPGAGRAGRFGARRPADAHQRRRELPGLPRRHPGPRPDGRRSAPRRSASGRRLVDVDIDRVDFSERPFRIWARGTEYRGPVGHRRHRRVGAVARSRQRDPAARPRRVGAARPATASSSATARSPSSAAATPPSRRRPTSPSSRRRSTCSTGATRSAPARSWSIARSAHPKIEIHPNTAVEEVLGDEKVDGLRCATR